MTASRTVLVTGGAGFIGSALVRRLIEHERCRVINVDSLTYASNLGSLASVATSGLHVLERVDVCDGQALQRLLAQYRPSAIYHLAAETHVDRSIAAPDVFIRTNMVGTYELLKASAEHSNALSGAERRRFRFVHVSTDEVFGELGPSDAAITEDSRYRPSSPYSASKAGADHLARAWGRTFGLPVIVTHASNNFGPCQAPDKLIPMTISNALSGVTIPVYGDGQQIRDWMYVDDFARALCMMERNGIPGEAYAVGAGHELANHELVNRIFALLERIAPALRPAGGYGALLRFVADRAGHDRRYSVDASKIRRELGWQPVVPFDEALEKTVRWYIENRHWWIPLCGKGGGFPMAQDPLR